MPNNENKTAVPAESIDNWGGKARQASKAKGDKIADDIEKWGRRSRIDIHNMIRQAPRVRYQKPNDFMFFKVVTPKDDWREFLTIEDRESRKTYLVKPSIADTIPGIQLRAIVQCVSIDGQHFLWGLRVPAGNQQPNEWVLSAWRAAEEATERWVRIASDMSSGQYIITICVDPNAPSAQPSEQSFATMLDDAFSDALIQSENDPIVQYLLGKALSK